MANTKKIILIVAALFVMCSMLSTAVAAENALGVTYTATLDNPTITASDVDQTVVMTITTNKAVNVDGIGFKVVSPEGFGTAVSHPVIAFAKSDYNASALMFGWSHDWAESDYYTTETIAVVTYTVPANTPAGTYQLGVTELSLTVDFGEPWEDGGEVVTTLTVTAPKVPVTEVGLDRGTMDLVAGESQSLNVAVLPENATNKTVSFKSSDDTVATVDENGKITAVKPGTATITVTTEDGGFTAQCVVTVSCGHTELTTVPAQASDCKTQGWDEYKTCVCGQLFSADGLTKIDAVPFRPLSTEHKGGTATCTVQAVCELCGASYGELAAHTYTAETKKEEALVSEGTCAAEAVYYYSCSGCGAVEANAEHTFKGEKNAEKHAGGTEIVGASEADHETQTKGYTGDTKCLGCGAVLVEGTEILPTPHEPGKYVSANEGNTQHIQLCSICDAPITEVEDHTSTGDNVATCVKEATCDVCGLTYGELSTEHVPGEWVHASEGEIDHIQLCALCQEPLGVAEEHSSTGDNVATCEKVAVCDVCGLKYGEKADHTYADEYDIQTKEGHAKTCTVCGTESQLEAHVDDATGEFCEVCGFVYHTCGGKEVTLVPEIPATCTVDGQKAYYICSCGKNYADKDATTEVTDLADLVIKAGHKITVQAGYEATCLEDGLTEGRYCSVCKEVFAVQEVIPATGHDWTAWVTVKVEGETRYQERYCACGAKQESIIDNGHKHNLIHVAAVEATCETNGNIEYWYCDGCDWMETIGGVATNKLSVITPAAHKLVHVEAVAATCETNGNIEYWYCSNCDWMETIGGVATNKLSVITPAAHNLVHVEAVAATCETNGNIEYWYCSNCDWMETIGGVATNKLSVITPAAHNLVHVEAKEATCLDLGNIEYWYCTNCDWMETIGGVATNKLSVILPLVDHKIEHVAAKEATCEAEGNVEYWYCTVCGYAWLDEARTLVTNLQSVKTPAAHDLVHVEAKAATCFEPGNIEYWYCTKCSWMETIGGVATNNLAVVLPIVHNIEHVEAKAPTATENGNIEYWYCKDCGYAWLDEFCTKNTNLKAVILPATGETTTEPGESSDTGDNAIFFVVALVAVATVATTFVSFKKKED